MIEVNTKINKFVEDGVEYTLKEYDIITSYPHSIVKIYLDELFNQTSTNNDGVASISTFENKTHHIKIDISDETYENDL